MPKELPGPWDEARNYLVPGKTLNALRDGIIQGRPINTDGTLLLTETKTGVNLGLNPVFLASAECPLGDALPDGTDIYLRAGYIRAGAIHTSVGGDATTFTPAVGDHIWAEVQITAGLTDGSLDGSFTAANPALGTGAAVPDNHEWTDAANVGKAYAPLGQFLDDGSGNPVWQKAGCGDVTFLFCAVSTVSATVHSYRG